MKEICVVHLVRAMNGIFPLSNFLESYKLNLDKIDHDLVILFKGFNSEEQLQEYRIVLEPFKYKEIHVSDEGFDITAYFVVPGTFEYKYYCFLNSFSVILDDEWLSKMYQYISKDNVGMVGATGSFQSLYIGPHLRKLLIQRAIPKSNFPILRRFWWGRLDWTFQYYFSYSTLRTFINMFTLRVILLRKNFYPFPNPHLRSNAFMISRDVILRVICPKMHNKMDAYKCESGKNSITRQVEKLDKSVLIVGKDGKAYEKNDWWLSNTFWRCNQENLLVADNQTRAYLSGDLKTKAFLSHNAWGAKASPESPVFSIY